MTSSSPVTSGSLRDFGWVGIIRFNNGMSE
jgi:hypothetical protein